MYQRFLVSFLIPLCIAPIAPSLARHVDSIYDTPIYFKDLSTKENLEEFFQFKKPFMGRAEVHECPDPTVPSVPNLLLYQVGDCNSGVSLDSLLQRADKKTKLWLLLLFKETGPEAFERAEAFKYFHTNFNLNLNLYYGFHIVRGPNAVGGVLTRHDSVFPPETECNIVFMFDEWTGESAGYTLEQLSNMKLEVMNVKLGRKTKYVIYVALDVYHLSLTEDGLSVLQDVRLILYTVNPEVTPDLMQLKPRVSRLMKLTDHLYSFLNGDMQSRIFAQFPFVDWNMQAAAFQLHIPDNFKSLNAIFTSNDRLLRVNAIPCAANEDYSLASSCAVVPQPSSDYLLQVADKTMTIIFKFPGTREALKSIPFGDYRYPPFVLIQPIVGPNAPEVRGVVNVTDALLPDVRVRYVFGFVERSLLPSNAYEKKHIESLIGLLRMDIVESLPAFGIRLHVSLMAHESVAQLLHRLSEWPKFQWLIVYQRFYQKESPDYDLSEVQVRELKRTIRALGVRDTYLLVDEKLRKQLYNDEVIPGLTIPDVETTTSTVETTTTTEETTLETEEYTTATLETEAPPVTLPTVVMVATETTTTTTTVYPTFTPILTTKADDDAVMSGCDSLRGCVLGFFLVMIFVVSQ